MVKSEIEIRDKLTYYEGMLSGIRTREAMDSPQVFTALSQDFPNEAIALLRSSLEMDESAKKLPPEDRGWFQQLFKVYSHLLEQLLESKVDILAPLSNGEGGGHPPAALAMGFMKRWCVFTGCVFSGSYSPARIHQRSVTGLRTATGKTRKTLEGG